MKDNSEKPLGGKAYGSIPHLPGSRKGPADRGLSDQQASLLTVKTRDRHDLVIVQEKLDGSCVAVAKINGAIIPLTRAGYNPRTSPYKMHHHFADWVEAREERFADLLNDGERCVGEWLMEAHGTRYDLPHEPFALFDIMLGGERATVAVVTDRAALLDFTTPRVIHAGGAFGVDEVLAALEPSGHGAIDPVEGAVWRMERRGRVDFLGKYVRPDKQDGKYLVGIGATEPTYNWTPR